MKTSILLLLTLLATSALAQVPVQLAWQASTTAGVTNYTLYASQSANFTNNLLSAARFEAGTSLTATATVTAGTRWFYCSTAWKNGQESKPSNVVSYIAPTVGSPQSFTLSFTLPPGATITSTDTNITITFP